MSRSYNHIKHFVDNNDYLQTNCKTWRRRSKFNEAGNHDANQLDGKQRHTGFDYYEYDVPKFGTAGRTQCSLDRSSFNFQEHLEDLEHDQARYQSIYGHGYGQTC